MYFRDELAEMRREPVESEGQQVLRHLYAIVAWHAAAKSLLDRKSRLVAQTLVVGLVQVVPINPGLMTSEEVIQEFFHRYPTLSPEVHTIGDIIRENHTQAKFTGTTHTEATLTGLPTYFSPGSRFVNNGVLVKEEDNLRFLKELVEPVCCCTSPPHAFDKILECRRHSRKPSPLVKSVIGVATGSAVASVISSSLAHMGFYILGLILGWELISLFSELLKMIYG